MGRHSAATMTARAMKTAFIDLVLATAAAYSRRPLRWAAENVRLVRPSGHYRRQGNQDENQTQVTAAARRRDQNRKSASRWRHCDVSVQVETQAAEGDEDQRWRFEERKYRGAFDRK